MSEDLISKLSRPDIPPATDEEILAYLRRSRQIAKIAAAIEREAVIMNACKQLGIVISEEELQAAGDSFRQEHKLLSAPETSAWLAQQRMTVEDWSREIQVSLLTQRLKEILFGETVDTHYMSNRNDYRRVALSQILVYERVEAERIIQLIRVKPASFCALALDYSQGKQSKENGGFLGIHFLAELQPEIAQAVTNRSEGEVIDPIQTQLGYHILKLEKWLPIELREVREQMLEYLFQAWLEKKNHSTHLAQ
ncbi:MAG: peptidylprolyl isomerase [Coleofasciculus sp. D1-CHI-01]|uniref:peptidylprolyl isomerase n=1 Tax=Coleofasciculus sp. D1-CHI-01 TaxID=3068482 RepID=UPI00330248EB